MSMCFNFLKEIKTRIQTPKDISEENVFKSVQMGSATLETYASESLPRVLFNFSKIDEADQNFPRILKTTVTLELLLICNYVKNDVDDSELSCEESFDYLDTLLESIEKNTAGEVDVSFKNMCQSYNPPSYSVEEVGSCLIFKIEYNLRLNDVHFGVRT